MPAARLFWTVCGQLLLVLRRRLQLQCCVLLRVMLSFVRVGAPLPRRLWLTLYDYRMLLHWRREAASLCYGQALRALSRTLLW